MPEFGYALSSEEHPPNDLVRNAKAAEGAGFAGLRGDLSQELATPILIEQACELVRDEDLESLPAGPDPEPYLESVREYEQAGFSHVYFHQIGRDQEGFFRFWREQLQPRL